MCTTGFLIACTIVCTSDNLATSHVSHFHLRVVCSNHFLPLFLFPSGGGHRCSEPGCHKVGRGRLRRCRGHTATSTSSSFSSAYPLPTADSAIAIAAATAAAAAAASAAAAPSTTNDAVSGTTAPASSFLPDSHGPLVMQPAVPLPLPAATPPLATHEWQSDTNGLVVMPPGAEASETMQV